MKLTLPNAILALSLALAAQAASPEVLAISVDRIVRPITVEVVKHAIAQADRDHAAAILLRLNTPRGSLGDTREIGRMIAESRVPVIVTAASDERQLLTALDGREITRPGGRHEILHTAGAEIVDYRRTARERIISAVADPNISFPLLLLGILGIYAEFTLPGFILPGVAGGVLALLGVSVLAALPINWIGFALLLLGAGLLILQTKFTSYGLFSIAGILAIILGARLLINVPPELQIRWSTALAVTLPFALITIFLLSIAVKARANKSVP